MIRWTAIFLFGIPGFMTAQQADSIPLTRSIGFAYENDLLAIPVNGRTDYYYTGGSFLKFNLPGLKKNPLSKILLTLKNGRDESFGISVSQLGFTPTSIRYDSILVGDRPFAGTIFIGLNRVSVNTLKQVRLTSKFDLGVIGPLAIGYETQKFIHEKTNNPEPHGWQFQIANDAYVNYSVKLEKGLLAKKNAVELIVHAAVQAGTIYNNVGLGLTIRGGKMNHYFIEQGNSNRLQVWAYSRTEIKLVGYDATLQGGFLNTKSEYVIPSSNIKRGVLSETAGVVIVYKRIRLEYFNTFLTPEFKNGKSHLWGHLGLEYFF